MKRKIFSVLFALVLALSLSLITAVPVAAQEVGEEFQYSKSGWVKWAEEAQAGDYSALLGLADPADEARVAVPVSMAFDDLTSLSYWYYIKTAALDTVPDAALKDSMEPDFTDFTSVDGYAAPYAVIELDTTGGTTANAWVVEARYADDSIEAWEQRSLGTTNYFHAAGGGVPVELALPNIATLADIKAHAFFADAAVLKVKVMMGDWHAYITNSPEAYVDDIGVNVAAYPLEPKAVVNIDAKWPVQGVDGDTSFDTIQAAIGDAQTGQTIIVADGTYNENIVVNESLTLKAASSPIIDGDGALGPGVRITAANVTFQGFTVTNFTCDPYAPPEYPSGAGMAAIWATGDGVVIDGNIIYNIRSTAAPEDLTNPDMWPAGIGIDVAASGVEVTNNLVHDVDSIGIRVRSDYEEAWPGDTLMSDILVEGNTVYNTANTGVLVAGKVTIVTIKGNEIYNSLQPTPYSLWILASPDSEHAPSHVTVEGNTIYDGYGNVRIDGASNIAITGNTISGAIPHYSDPDNIKGKNIYIRDACYDINITNNDITDAEGYGVWTSSAAATTINYNNISGNTYGVENTITTHVNALYNYWGDPSGPTAADFYGTGDSVSTYVGYEPWLHTTQETVVASNTRYYGYDLVELEAGWNIWSTPIALDAQADTWGEYKALGDDLNLASGANAYYFDASATPQIFRNVTDSYVLKPCDAIYIHMAAADTAPILFSPEVSVPTKTLYAGWNLVSLSYFDNIGDPGTGGRSPEVALASVYYVGGANNIGYSQVVSPAVNQYAWSGVRGNTIESFTWVGEESEEMYPCKGYWVNMVNGGTLVGMVFTPVSPLLPLD